MGFLREPSHLLIIAIVILVLFGSRRLPDAARGIGRSLRIFKSEIQQMKDDQPPAGTRPANSETGPVEGKVMDGDDREAQARAEARARQADAHRDV